MWYQIILFISVYFFTSCANKMLVTKYNDVKLTINTTEDTVSDLINVTVSFENNTTDNFYLLNKRFVAISCNRNTMWNLKIFFQDTVPMTTPILINYGTVSKKDYVLLKSGDKYTFHFNVDFRTLIQEDLSNFRKINDDYGEYSLKLVYADPFLVDKKAFRGKIESNVIRLVYKKR